MWVFGFRLGIWVLFSEIYTNLRIFTILINFVHFYQFSSFFKIFSHFHQFSPFFINFFHSWKYIILKPEKNTYYSQNSSSQPMAAQTLSFAVTASPIGGPIMTNRRLLDLLLGAMFNDIVSSRSR